MRWEHKWIDTLVDKTRNIFEANYARPDEVQDTLSSSPPSQVSTSAGTVVFYTHYVIAG